MPVPCVIRCAHSDTRHRQGSIQFGSGSISEMESEGSLLPHCRLTIEWAHGGIMSGMVIRRIVTAILAEVLLGDIVKTGLMAVTLVLLVSISGAAQRGTGSVCVAARIDDPFWKEPATLPNSEIILTGLRSESTGDQWRSGLSGRVLKSMGLISVNGTCWLYSIRAVNQLSPSASSSRITRAPTCA